jgi:hypothetical protein
MKVSICTTVMNRLDHFSKTIQKNLLDNGSDVEFVVLDYNSEDGLGDWVKTHLMQYIKSGRLVFYQEKTAKAWMPSHSRNICALQATGDIICNVDADHFTGTGFDKACKMLLPDPEPAIACVPWILKFVNGSTHGRIALWKSQFKAIGGYDEDFIYGWGAEDNDLFRRCRAAGFQVRHFHPKWLSYINHGEEERLQKVDFGALDRITEQHKELMKKMFEKEGRKALEGNKMRSRLIHDGISEQNVSENRLVANADREWGVAELIKNFETPCKSGFRKTPLI